MAVVKIIARLQDKYKTRWLLKNNIIDSVFQETATYGEHIWFETNVSGDFCYVGEQNCIAKMLVSLVRGCFWLLHVEVFVCFGFQTGGRVVLCVCLVLLWASIQTCVLALMEMAPWHGQFPSVLLGTGLKFFQTSCLLGRVTLSLFPASLRRAWFGRRCSVRPLQLSRRHPIFLCLRFYTYFL